MLMLHDIKKMLRIIDKNLTISAVSEETIHKERTLVIEASLTKKPTHCPHCGCSTSGPDNQRLIVKNGFKKSVVRFEACNHMPTVMRLAKQRYHCRSCDTHWTLQTYFVDKHCFIAKQLKMKILTLLKEKISLTLIAKLCSVSLSTVIRLLKSLEPYLPTQHTLTLPKVLMVDEFRSHAMEEDKMSFICADGETGALVDVFPSRKLKNLETRFQKSPDCDKVSFLVTDMNEPYIQLIPKVFPHAQLVIDRFHVVKLLNEAFNAFRVREMKQLKKNKQEVAYKKIKSNWRRFLKNRQHINISTYRSWRSFPTPTFPLLTEAMMMDRLLDFSPALKLAYDCFHDLADAFRAEEADEFFALLNALPDELDQEMKEKLENLKTYEIGIRNALTYPYSNGKLEAKNTHIKTLKRVSYGFRSFTNMRSKREVNEYMANRPSSDYNEGNGDGLIYLQASCTCSAHGK